VRALSPEIYGSMNDPQRIELKGLEVIMDRLLKGSRTAAGCSDIEDDLEGTSFERLVPPKRRRGGGGGGRGGRGGGGGGGGGGLVSGK